MSYGVRLVGFTVVVLSPHCGYAVGTHLKQLQKSLHFASITQLTVWFHNLHFTVKESA